MSKTTWSYKNRVSKHFVIFLNFPCLLACLLRCLLMSFFFFSFWLVLWLGICVQVDVDRITISPPPPPSLRFFFCRYPQFSVKIQVTVIEISVRLKLVSVPFSSLLLDIGHFEKGFPESIM